MGARGIKMGGYWNRQGHHSVRHVWQGRGESGGQGCQLQ